MFYASRPIIGPRKGVSEVMGALLLIIVVIVAVASLASFVSIAESNAQKRQSYITSVTDENLMITGAQFASSSIAPNQWAEIHLTVRNTNTAPSTLTQIKAGDVWLSSWSVTSQNTGDGTPVLYGGGHFSLTVPAKGVVQVNLENLTCTIMTGCFANQVSEGSGLDQGLLTSNSLTIELLTANGNFFNSVYNPPTSLAQVGISSLSYQYFSRDVVSVDGSKSLSSNNTRIESYSWTVEVPVTTTFNATSPGCTNTAFTYPSDHVTVGFSGELGQFHQEAFPALSPAVDYCLTGPFQVGLLVTDSLNFTSTSQASIIPQDSNMAPPSSFSAFAGVPPSTTCGGVYPCTISGTVMTVLGTFPAPNTATMIINFPGGTTTASVSSTTGKYSTTITCSSAGTITVSLNQLPSQALSC